MATSHLRSRPLDRVRSIKVKLGLVVVGSVVATVGAIFTSLVLGVHQRFAFVGGLVVSLLIIQFLAHGIVLPLREMVAATQAMANGDYRQRVTATAQDEVGSLARSFNTMAARLDEVESQRRELMANVSHELRTPIAALRARLENLADGVEALDAEAIAAMLKGTQRLSRLVDQLLKLSQFESGAIRIDRQKFSVDDVVGDAAAEVRPVRTDVRLVTDVDSGLVGAGDPERIHEVLTNLLSNAVRHSPAAASSSNCRPDPTRRSLPPHPTSKDTHGSVLPCARSGTVPAALARPGTVPATVPRSRTAAAAEPGRGLATALGGAVTLPTAAPALPRRAGPRG